MRHSIFFTVDAAVLCLALFVGCIVMVTGGKTLRDKFLGTDEQESKGGVNALLGALFGLWGLLLAFTFGNVSTRFDNLKTTIVEEANVIRTVILRIDTLPESLRPGFREDIGAYLQTRIEYYNFADDAEKLDKLRQDTKETGKRLWTIAIDASNVPNFGIPANAMLTALSSMYDLAARRDAMLMSGLPGPISYMLFLIALVISFVGGFTSPILRTKEWVVICSFIFLACLVIYITLDLARPMRGFIKPDVGQERIEQLQQLL